jgi:class 3 adenylate cyclase/tetratricopeptide (TPR) repeat protein
MPVSCPGCGTQYAVGVKFCAECGRRLVPGAYLAASPAYVQAAAEPKVQIEGFAERRQLSVMFCDLIGSTALASKLDPEDLHKLIGAYQRCVTEVVSRFGGFVARYVGDGALVYFGYPGAQEDDAERAIRAGLQVAEAVSRLTLLNDYRPEVRIGIATGLVVVGSIIGTEPSAAHDVAGETPNLAARLQALAEPNSVVIEANTVRLAGGLFEYLDLGPVQLKGFEKPVRAWRVLRASATKSRFEALHEAEFAPLVGRGEELDLLLQCWQQARTGTGRVVLLTGEPGIGKSRLTAMLRERLVPESHSELHLFCLPHQEGSPLHPFIRQLERASDFDRGDTTAERLDKLAHTVGKGRAHVEDVALLADLLSLPADERYPAVRASPQKRRKRTLEALLRQLERLPRQRPALLIFEDAHWIDPTSRELLEIAIGRVANLPVLAIITFRADFHFDWGSHPHVIPLALRQLGRQESAALVASIAGDIVLPPDVIDDIVLRTDGIPLFLEELTKAVLEEVVLAGTSKDGAAPSEKRPLIVPATLRASLLARLDRLGSAKEIAQIGAAIGREFSYDLLAAVAGRTDAELHAALGRLTQSGLAVHGGTANHATYLFKHALVQDAAYDTMLRATRQRLHQNIVEVLESTFPEMVETQPELLAHHAAEAGMLEAAIGYWQKAGLRALVRSTMPEAIVRLRKGLGLVARLSESAWRHQQELGLQIALGKALIATKGYAVPVTGETFARARQLCALLSEPPQLMSVLHGLWTHALLRADLASAKRQAGEVLQLGLARNDVLWTLMGYRFSGVTAFPLGEFSAARKYLARGLELFDPAQRPLYASVTVDDGRVVMMFYSGMAHLYLGELDQSRKCNEAAVSEARRLAQPYSLSHALIGISLAELKVGFPNNALRHLSELLPLTEEYGIAYYRAVGTIYRGVALTAIGQAESGRQEIERGLTAYRATGAFLYLPTFLTMFAEAWAMEGNPRQGLKELQDAAAVVEATNTRNDESEMLRVRGNLLRAIDDTKAAEASLREALEVARRQGAKLLELRAATSLSMLLRDQERRPEALRLITESYGGFTEGLQTPFVKDAKALLDALV